MAKAAKNSSPVIELEAEEIPLETQIENQLVKNNVTEKVIAGLKEKFGGLQLKDLEDKESYLEIKEARKEVRGYGILAERICEAGRSDAIKIQRLWLAKQKEVLGKIAEVQDPLDLEIKKFDDEVARKEAEAAQRREEAYIKRQSQLLKMGATFEGGSFVLNHIAYEMNLVKESDEDIWTETILPKYQREYEKNEAEKVAAEKKREEEALALKRQQEEMDRQRKELEEQQAAFKKQQEEAAQVEQARLQKIREEEDRRNTEKRLEEQAKAEEADRQRREKIDKRISQLRAMGLEYNMEYKSYTYEDVAISMVVEIQGMNDTDWDALVLKTIPTIERCKKEVEEKRLAKIEEDKRVAAEAAATKERERILEEQRQQKIKEEQEAARKAEEALQANDKTKWRAYVDYHNAVVVPEMKSPTYRAKIAEAQKFIQKAVNL